MGRIGSIGRVAGTVFAAGAIALGAVACGSDSSSSDGGKTIALLLPESKTTRYDQQDRPLFEAKLKELQALRKSGQVLRQTVDTVLARIGAGV